MKTLYNLISFVKDCILILFTFYTTTNFLGFRVALDMKKAITVQLLENTVLITLFLIPFVLFPSP